MWPILAIEKDGNLFYMDVSDGNHHTAGLGWIVCLPWGKKRKVHMFEGDSRISIEQEDCSVELLGWTRSQEEYEDKYGEIPKLHISIVANNENHKS